MSNPAPSPLSPPELDVRKRREILAWAMYDSANSAFSTLLITIVAIYLQKVVFPEGETGAVVYAWGIGISALLTAILSPITVCLPTRGRRNASGWRPRQVGGAVLCVVMAIVPLDMPWVIAGVFTLACLCYELSLGYYNAFLPEIADEATMDKVSAWGFGLGYVGGGAGAADRAGRAARRQARWGCPTAPTSCGGLAIMGVWWGVFSLPAVLVLRDKAAPRQGPARSGSWFAAPARSFAARSRTCGSTARSAGSCWASCFTTTACKR